MSSPAVLDYDIYSKDVLFVVEGSEYGYAVAYDFEKKAWWCSCADFKFRRRFCKHCESCNEILIKEGIVASEDVMMSDSWVIE